MNSRRLVALDDIEEEIGVVHGQGAELVEEYLLCHQLLAERAARGAGHDNLQAARARRHATTMAIAGVDPCRMLEIQSRAPEIY